MADRNAMMFLLVAAAAVMATVRVSPQTRPLVITGVNVVDVADGRILPGRTVTINGGTISSVTQNAAPPAGAQVVDGRDKFLIPGLWDMHAHVEATHQSSLQLYVANGVTGITVWYGAVPHGVLGRSDDGRDGDRQLGLRMERRDAP